MTATRGGPRPAGVLRSARGPVLVALAVALLALVVAVLGATSGSGLLDPQSYRPGGGHAVAAVLESRGVRVVRLVDPALLPEAATPDSTVFIPYPELEPENLGGLLARLPGHLVVVGSPPELLAGLGLRPGGGTPVPDAARDPDCPDPVADRAGRADTGGTAYDLGTSPGAVGCYPAQGAPTLLRIPAARLTLVGSPTPFENDALLTEGDASLALGLLGQDRNLLWLVPDPVAPSGVRQVPLEHFVPPWVRWGLAELVVAVVLLALWRARRMGPVVSEPLPVVVRAAEAVEGRARLYRAARARAHAAQVLRAGAADRLSRRLGLGGGDLPDALVDAVRRATGGRDTWSAERVRDLLYGAAPSDDSGLVRLADDLDRLIREAGGVHTSVVRPAGPETG